VNLAYPYQFAPNGRTASTTDTAHIRDLIEQVLFTAPGERVMHPDLGSGAARLTFAPNSVELAGATQMLIQAALQQWLNTLIVVQGVDVQAADASLTIAVQYLVRTTGDVVQQTFQRSLGGAS
jgi:phage baseplate assembly protein W